MTATLPVGTRLPVDPGALAPGPELAGLLAGVTPPMLTAADLLDVMAGWERLVSWAQAGALAAIAEFARRRPSPHQCDAPASPTTQVSEFAADEIASRLRLSRRGAEGRLGTALELADRLPGTAAALAGGQIDLPRARAVEEWTGLLEDPAAAAAVEARVLRRAPDQTAAQLRASLARAVLAVDPAAAERRHRREIAERSVETRPLPDGMAALQAYGPADGVATVHTALTALAHRAAAPDDHRDLHQRRFDALVDLACAALDDPDLSRPHRARPHLQLVVTASTLLELSEEPGELAGHGPIPASMARRMAAEADWRRLLCDPVDGGLLAVDRRTYAPPAAIADHVLTRDRTCRFVGCRQPAWRCDLDHTVPHPEGETCPGNLGPLCRHHHRLKHQAGWQLTQPTPGEFVWTGPTGHTYVVRADPLIDPDGGPLLLRTLDPLVPDDPGSTDRDPSPWSEVWDKAVVPSELESRCDRDGPDPPWPRA